MVFALGLPDNYPLVLGVAAATPLLTIWQGFLVGSARKAARVSYPQMYATKEEEKASNEARKFNCTQRAHQNTLENLPQVYASLIIGGLEYPRLVAAFWAAWLVGRVVYTTGYATGDPAKRVPGAVPSTLGLLGTVVTAIVASYKIFSRSNVQLY